jgi:hypothetical protein
VDIAYASNKALTTTMLNMQFQSEYQKKGFLSENLGHQCDQKIFHAEFLPFFTEMSFTSRAKNEELCQCFFWQQHVKLSGPMKIDICKNSFEYPVT